MDEQVEAALMQAGAQIKVLQEKEHRMIDAMWSLTKDAERWRKARRLLATKMFDYYSLEGGLESEIDAWVDAAPSVGDA